MILLKIDNIDFSNAVNERNYSVNHSDIYKEWIDINQRTHRETLRRQISGNVQLVFTAENIEGFATQTGSLIATQGGAVLAAQASKEGVFSDWAAIATAGGPHSMFIYVESLDDVVELDGFISYTARAIRMNKDLDNAVGIIVVDCEILEK